MKQFIIFCLLSSLGFFISCTTLSAQIIKLEQSSWKSHEYPPMKSKIHRLHVIGEDDNGNYFLIEEVKKYNMIKDEGLALAIHWTHKDYDGKRRGPEKQIKGVKFIHSKMDENGRITIFYLHSESIMKDILYKATVNTSSLTIEQPKKLAEGYLGKVQVFFSPDQSKTLISNISDKYYFWSFDQNFKQLWKTEAEIPIEAKVFDPNQNQKLDVYTKADVDYFPTYGLFQESPGAERPHLKYSNTGDLFILAPEKPLYEDKPITNRFKLYRFGKTKKTVEVFKEGLFFRTMTIGIHPSGDIVCIGYYANTDELKWDGVYLFRYNSTSLEANEVYDRPLNDETKRRLFPKKKPAKVKMAFHHLFRATYNPDGTLMLVGRSISPNSLGYSFGYVTILILDKDHNIIRYEYPNTTIGTGTGDEIYYGFYSNYNDENIEIICLQTGNMDNPNLRRVQGTAVPLRGKSYEKQFKLYYDRPTDSVRVYVNKQGEVVYITGYSKKKKFDYMIITISFDF